MIQENPARIIVGRYGLHAFGAAILLFFLAFLWVFNFTNFFLNAPPVSATMRQVQRVATSVLIGIRSVSGRRAARPAIPGSGPA
jgi:hypothetical protein